MVLRRENSVANRCFEKTAANKQSKEQATTEVRQSRSKFYSVHSFRRKFIAKLRIQSLDKISRSLPRLDVYRELYPTGRMIHLVSQLYAITLRYLLRVFTYYKKSTWKGSIGIATNKVLPALHRLIPPIP